MHAAQDAGRAQRAEERDALSEAVEGLKQIDPLLQAVAAVPWLMATGVRGTEAGATDARVQLSSQLGFLIVAG